MNTVAPVELLKRQYLQLTRPEELAIPRKELLRLPDIQAQIYNNMFNEANITYGPPERYRFRVLKRLVQALEDAIEDPEEDVGFLLLLLRPRSPLEVVLVSSTRTLFPHDSLLMCPSFSRAGDFR